MVSYREAKHRNEPISPEISTLIVRHQFGDVDGLDAFDSCSDLFDIVSCFATRVAAPTPAEAATAEVIRAFRYRVIFMVVSFCCCGSVFRPPLYVTASCLSVCYRTQHEHAMSQVQVDHVGFVVLAPVLLQRFLAVVRCQRIDAVRQLEQCVSCDEA